MHKQSKCCDNDTIHVLELLLLESMRNTYKIPSKFCWKKNTYLLLIGVVVLAQEEVQRCHNDLCLLGKTAIGNHIHCLGITPDVATIQLNLCEKETAGQRGSKWTDG